MLRIFRNKFVFSTSKFQEYLKVMQVTRTTTQQQLKAQFIKMAKKHHPDSGSAKDPARFKSILQAYRYLSVESNWPSSNNSNNNQFTNFANQKAQSKQQKDRRQTYDYFNTKRRGFGVENQSSMGYDSFFQTLKAAPELKVFTLGFIGLGIMIWIFMVTGMSRRVGPYKVENQIIFYSKQQEEEYWQKQRRRKNRRKQIEDKYEKQYYKSFNFSKRFNKEKERGKEQAEESPNN